MKYRHRRTWSVGIACGMLSIADVVPRLETRKGDDGPPPDGGIAASCSGNGLDLMYPFSAADGTWTLSLGPNDDGSTGALSLGFAFRLFGQSYGSCWINNNGNVTFDGPSGAYTPSGLPFAGHPMVAGFWADVDTRPGSSGKVWHKFIDSNGNGAFDTLAVTWDNVGRYNQATDLLNTFQIVLTDGQNPFVGLGQHVALSYDTMCWTTGSASGGAGGFGGVPATVGLNAGDGSQYLLIGRFDRPDSFYDGPGGQNDGVHYLDGRIFLQCPADTDGTGTVDAEDLAAVLFAWGLPGTAAGPADVTRDGLVDGVDMAAILASWGECPD